MRNVYRYVEEARAKAKPLNHEGAGEVVTLMRRIFSHGQVEGFVGFEGEEFREFSSTAFGVSDPPEIIEHWGRPSLSCNFTVFKFRTDGFEDDLEAMRRQLETRRVEFKRDDPRDIVRLLETGSFNDEKDPSFNYYFSLIIGDLDGNKRPTSYTVLEEDGRQVGVYFQSDPSKAYAGKGTQGSPVVLERFLLVAEPGFPPGFSGEREVLEMDLEGEREEAKALVDYLRTKGFHYENTEGLHGTHIVDTATNTICGYIGKTFSVTPNTRLSQVISEYRNQSAQTS